MRTLHLIDIENLCGEGRPDMATAQRALEQYLVAANWRPGDHVVVACNRGLARDLFYRLPKNMPCQRRVGRPGPNGADLELLDAAYSIDAPSRFDRIVIGSGDGCFVPLVSKCRARATPVEVVLGKGGLNRRMGLHPQQVTQLSASSSLLATQSN